MNKQNMRSPAALLVALGMSVAVAASAQTGAPPAGQNNPKAPDNTMKATSPGNSFSGWMTDYSAKHDGRISRKAYMDEAGQALGRDGQVEQGAHFGRDQPDVWLWRLVGSMGNSSTMAGSSTTSGGATGSSTGAGGGMNKGK